MFGALALTTSGAWAAKPREQMSTKVKTKSSFHRLIVRTEANRVRLKYRADDGPVKQTQTVKRGVRKFRIPLETPKVRVRALKDKQSRHSRWAKVILNSGSGSQSTTPTPAPPPTVGVADQLRETAGLRVLFGHQSVGRNILSEVSTVYAGYGINAPRQLTAPVSGVDGPYLSEINIGTNRDPDSKIDEFDDLLRSGVGDRVDVAFLKFCYVDIEEGTDINRMFERYTETLRKLEATYPGVTFLHLTVPLTTYSATDNLLREQYNQKVRKKYGGSGRLFDIAKIESTRPSGSRVGGTRNGQQFYLLHEAYASDKEGHLNETGARRVGLALMQQVAAAEG